MIKRLDTGKIAQIEKKAADIRCLVLEMIARAQVGHPGGSLSVADILAALYFHVLKLEPKRPDWPDRDRLILSKGHGATALYSALALKGYFSTSELETFGTLGSRFQVHPDRRKVPGVEASTGTLGQGLSVGAGIALGARLDRKTYRTYVILGDGEVQEGQVWEGAMFGSHYCLDNLTVILDYNNVQLMGDVPCIMEIAPLSSKWSAFGWNVTEIDGHDISQIIGACKDAEGKKAKPSIIIAKTLKGKGISFMENTHEWHGRAPTTEECRRAVCEIRNIPQPKFRS